MRSIRRMIPATWWIISWPPAIPRKSRGW
jgi:hypothetical protein